MIQAIVGIIVLIGISLPLQAEITRTPEFWKYWKSGLAEISTYQARTLRYGEMREAQAVLIYVYEEINDRTRIKIEKPGTAAALRVPVLKLNNVLKFNTGIYDYSVMTSVFAGLSGGRVKRDFIPKKISFTGQEWCGHVYHHLETRKNSVVSTLHSYFESEGNAVTTLPLDATVVYFEDELPILLRELDGEFMRPGQKRSVVLVRSLWDTRRRHIPLAGSTVEVEKSQVEELSIGLGNFSVYRWRVGSSKEWTEYFVESAHPRKLLLWKNHQGESGELLASRRKTYWELNRNQDENQRQELKLNFGVGEPKP